MVATLIVCIAEVIKSTIGVDQDLWCCTKDVGSESQNSNGIITFYAWDMAGQVCQYY